MSIETITANDIEELREIADWVESLGKTENAEFLRGMAHRYEVISGAYLTALQREERAA